MIIVEDLVPDVMLVCRNGHVVTDRLRNQPERDLKLCDRCGAATLARCSTCGQELPGAIPTPGMVPIGAPRPPQFCSTCGAAFPWAKRPTKYTAPALEVLENFLLRLTRVIRELRCRHGDRPPFRVEDERDLEDLLRALLPLHFDDIRPESRTPSYSPATRTDFLLMPDKIALVSNRAGREVREDTATQCQEDVTYYQQQGKCRTIVEFVYDPEGLLAAAQEKPWQGEGLEVRWVISE